MCCYIESLRIRYENISLGKEECYRMICDISYKCFENKFNVVDYISFYGLVWNQWLKFNKSLLLL